MQGEKLRQEGQGEDEVREENQLCFATNTVCRSSTYIQAASTNWQQRDPFHVWQVDFRQYDLAHAPVNIHNSCQYSLVAGFVIRALLFSDKGRWRQKNEEWFLLCFVFPLVVRQTVTLIVNRKTHCDILRTYVCTSHTTIFDLNRAAAGDLKRQVRKALEREVHFEERIIWGYFSQVCVFACAFSPFLVVCVVFPDLLDTVSSVCTCISLFLHILFCFLPVRVCAG